MAGGGAGNGPTLPPALSVNLKRPSSEDVDDQQQPHGPHAVVPSDAAGPPGVKRSAIDDPSGVRPPLTRGESLPAAVSYVPERQLNLRDKQQPVRAPSFDASTFKAGEHLSPASRRNGSSPPSGPLPPRSVHSPNSSGSSSGRRSSGSRHVSSTTVTSTEVGGANAGQASVPGGLGGGSGGGGGASSLSVPGGGSNSQLSGGSATPGNGGGPSSMPPGAGAGDGSSAGGSNGGSGIGGGGPSGSNGSGAVNPGPGAAAVRARQAWAAAEELVPVSVGRRAAVQHQIQQRRQRLRPPRMPRSSAPCARSD
ncbi:loricrin [Drosophila obscura]|uniref:loricrin n=1 Tax=Drosophila obscura TaxID=7282 RepID=UPI001BB27D14|nr:loricrin [Drosophila obscura]